MYSSIIYQWPKYRVLCRILTRYVVWYEHIFNYSDEKQTLQARYNEIISTYDSLIERICFGYATSLTDFEDLKQDVWLNIWESLSRFKGNCSIKTWVYRIVLNTCVTSLRKTYRQVSIVQLNGLYDVIDNDSDKKTLIAELHECIAQLNPLDKAIILLWLDDVCYDKIAQIMGMSRNNVALRLHRVKNKLKIMIEK